jgi:hypothetical protein
MPHGYHHGYIEHGINKQTDADNPSGMEFIRGNHTECPAKPGCKNGKFFHMNTTRKFSF